MRRAVGVMALVVVAAAGVARGNAPASSGLPVPVDGYGLAAVDRADVDAPGDVGLRLTLDYLRRPLRLWLDGAPRAAVTDEALAHVALSVGLHRRLEAGVLVPVSLAFYSAAGAAAAPGGAGQATHYDVAAGDLRLFLKVQAVRSRWVGLAFVAAAVLVSGDPHSYRSDGQWGGEARAVLDVGWRWFGLVANVGARLHDTVAARDARGAVVLSFGHELTWAAAVTASVHPRVGLAVEAAGSESLQPVRAGDERTAEVLGTVRVRAAPALELFVGGGRSVAPDAARSDDARVVTGLSWHPLGGRAGHAGDRDGDGVPDDRDACPDVPEDRDGFEDEDGCPDEDNDHDGIPDARDQCPNDPEDRDGFQDDDGCPDPDNDGDGVPDAVDRCPNQPEPHDGLQDGDGCPDDDVDGDGIPNDKDACPREPETFNGIDDQDGCPDGPQLSAPRTHDGDDIARTVQFPRNEARLEPFALATVEALARYLKRHPEIRRVRLEGHGDAVEPRAERLSRLRAEVVRDALIARGVETRRLDIVGYGRTRPRGPHADENRCVEWIVVDQPK